MRVSAMPRNRGVMIGRMAKSKAVRMLAVAGVMACLWPNRLARADGGGAATAPESPRGMVSSSPALSLNGLWLARLDPRGEGAAKKWFAAVLPVAPLGLLPSFACATSVTLARAWAPVEVPGVVNAGLGDLGDYRGKAWFRRQFRLRDAVASQPVMAAGAPQGRVILRFVGASMRSRVWLNERMVGEHRFAYAPFEFDVTSIVDRDGTNTLAVEVDNAPVARGIPDEKWQGWRGYLGISRDVRLEFRPAAAVTNLWMDSWKSQLGWGFETVAIVANHGDNGHVRLAAQLRYGDSGPVVWRAEQPLSAPPGETEARLRGALRDAQPWWPTSPTLYRLTATVEAAGAQPSSHTLSIRTAFRQIQTSGSLLLLNKEPLLIRGIARHEEALEHGSAVPLKRTRRDLLDIRELGANFLRTAHYTQHPDLYDLCDEMGLLVWTEIPAWKTLEQTLADPTVWDQWARPQIEEMIREYRRHPSVIVWSIGNEFRSDTAAGADYARRACDLVRRLDPSRLVTYASDRHRPRKSQDLGFEHPDFISINEYYGWYTGTLNDIGPLLDVIHERYPDKPLFVSEFGADGPPDRPSGGEDALEGKHYSLAYQNKFLRAHLEQIYAPARRAYVAGGSIWLYNDFIDPHRVGEGHPPPWNYVNLKGLVTLDRQRKPAFDVVQSAYDSLNPPMR